MRTTWLWIVLSIATVAVAGRTDLGTLLRRYERARTVAERLLAVESLAACHDARTVAAIDRIARRDSDVAVQVAAVRVLGERTGSATTTRLVGLAIDGGVSGFRVACARAIATRPGAIERLDAVLAAPRSSALDRLRVIETFGGIPTLDAYGRLVTAVSGADAGVRAAALRAIAMHAIGTTEIGDTLIDALRRFRDIETVVTALDLVEDHALDRWREIEPLVKDREEPAILESVIALGELHAFVEAQRLGAKKAAEGYGLERDDAPEPQERTRLDVVYAFDATGSTVGQIAQVKLFITDHAGPLVLVRRDVRVGIVAYRVGAKATPRTRTEILPLTHDVDAAIRFVEGIEQRGADSHGAAVADAVATALDRMPWRPNARRQVFLLADGRIDDRPRAYRIARQHHEADGTQLSVWYWSRTRRRAPDDLERLAAKGGGTFTIADPVAAPLIPGAPVPGGGGPPGSGR